MKLTLTGESWVLEDLEPIEWNFLTRLPEIASGKEFTSEQQRRLTPDPIDLLASDRNQQEGFLDDWSEYVVPELISTFETARNQVTQDLEATRNEADDSEAPRRMEVSNDRTEQWFSTLNQARLLMNEAHDLAEATERFFFNELDEEGIDPDRLLLLAQYEFYTALQSVLVEHRMLP